MEKFFRKTNVFEKTITSVINVIIVIFLAMPFLWIIPDLVGKKLVIISLFFVYNLLILLFNENRCLGMIAVDTYWEKKYSLRNKLIYLILYTLSFSTLFFWIFFPFDLFIFNMLFIQLPTILLTGTTLHGLFSGNITTVKKLK